MIFLQIRPLLLLVAPPADLSSIERPGKELGGSRLLMRCNRRRMFVVKRHTPMHAAKGVMVAFALLAWFSASNHCALSALRLEKKSEHACCQTEKPVETPSCSLQCCDSLFAALPQAVAAPALSLQELAPAWLEPAAEAPRAHFVSTGLSLDTGPPPSVSFAILVLNRSILVHAPPFVVV